MTEFRKLIEYHRDHGYDDSQILSMILSAEELAEETPNWRAEDDVSLPPAGNTCGPFTAYIHFFYK